MSSVKGIKLAAVSAGIKNNGSHDLVLIECAKGSVTSGVFTQNAFCAAPVTLCKTHMKLAKPRYFLINSGNANAGTGAQGEQNAILSCKTLAERQLVLTEEVLPYSTGVIGQQLPVEKIQKALPSLVSKLSEDNWKLASEGIMTTDTVAKCVSKKITIGDKIVTITGISKGAGMIQPNMATMLAYIATDAKVSQTDLDTVLNDAVNQSFNRITVDGDTSTNDSCMLIATGQSVALTPEHNNWLDFKDAVNACLKELAQMIIRDAEGATKFITINVKQGVDATECLQVAFTVAHSPLVKTAFFASDANWGRILMAVGRSGLQSLDINKVNLYLDNVCLIKAGEPDPSYTEDAGTAVMEQTDITVTIELGRGSANETVWTSDLSHDYVTINAEYRT